MPSRLILKPASIDSGIVFYHVTEEGHRIPNARIKADVKNMKCASKRTFLSNGSYNVVTPEHLLSACAGLGISNLEVDIYGEELPIFDGSSKKYVEQLQDNISVQHGAKIPVLVVQKPVILFVNKEKSPRMLMVLPGDSFKITYFITRSPFIINKQSFVYDTDTSEYIKDVALARTYILADEETIVVNGQLFYKGADSSTLTIKNNKLDPQVPLRFPNEFARHKTLDLLGDLSLLGKRIQGHVIAIDTGHRHNGQFVQKLNESIAPEYLTSDIEQIYLQLYDFLKKGEISFGIFLEIILALAKSYPNWGIGRLLKQLNREWEAGEDLSIFRALVKQSKQAYSYSGPGGVGKGTMWECMLNYVPNLMIKDLLYASRYRRFKVLSPDGKEYKALKELQDQMKDGDLDYVIKKLSNINSNLFGPLLNPSILGRKVTLNELVEFKGDEIRVYTEFDGVQYHFTTEDKLNRMREDQGIITATVAGYLQGIDANTKNSAQDGLHMLEAGIPILLAAKEKSNGKYYSFFVLPMSIDEFREKTQVLSFEKLVELFNNETFNNDETLEAEDLLRILRYMRDKGVMMLLNEFTDADIHELVYRLVFPIASLEEMDANDYDEVSQFKEQHISILENRSISDEQIASLFRFSYAVFEQLVLRLKNRENVAGKPFKFEENGRDKYKIRISNGILEVALAILNKGCIFQEMIINSWVDDKIPIHATKRLIFSIAMQIMNDGVKECGDHFPATISSTNALNRAATSVELSIIVAAFGGKDALAAKGITLDTNNTIISPSLEAPAEVRGGLLLVNPNTFRGPPEQLRVIFEGHELFHLLNPDASEKDAESFTVRYLFENRLLSSHLGWLENNNLGLTANREWLLQLSDLTSKEDNFLPRSFSIPMPFPDMMRARGVNSPEWLESYIMAMLILRKQKEYGNVIHSNFIFDSIESAFQDYGLSISKARAIDLLNGLRRRGVIKSQGNEDFSAEKDNSIVCDLDPRLVAVWADDLGYINNEIEVALNKGRNEFLRVIDAYGKIVELWRNYPVEAKYPVLRAIAIMEAVKQEKIVDLLLSRSQWGRLPLIDTIILMLAPDRVKEGWFASQAPQLIGRSIYFVAAEISLLAGGLGRVMQYHGKKMFELGANILCVEPHYRKYRDKSGNVHELDYTDASVVPIPVRDIRKLEGGFTTYVQGKQVDFEVSVGVNGIGSPAYLIRDISGYYTNILYEYSTSDSPASNYEFTEFFTKAALELIRYLELQKKKELGDAYKSPLVDCNDGQVLPIAAWRKIFYGDLTKIIKGGVDEDNIKATFEIFKDAVFCGTTHTYRNRVIIPDFHYGRGFLRNAGVPDEWLWVFMRDEFGRKYWDFTSAGLRCADIAKAVSAVHGYEMNARDPSVELFGITNGDDRIYS
ncbi:MAG: UDP-3-O-acyl-N-acetylglucosamine deacetylase, partial [Candidatus Omnitrophica bacterium]|nr:UDP-3-O-acyl-N-acetylglucosamine deacetylase [Candidatus Omnitrophota bacterium]